MRIIVGIPPDLKIEQQNKWDVTKKGRKHVVVQVGTTTRPKASIIEIKTNMDYIIINMYGCCDCLSGLFSGECFHFYIKDPESDIILQERQFIPSD